MLVLWTYILNFVRSARRSRGNQVQQTRRRRTMTTEAVKNEIIPVNYAEIDEFHDRVLGFRNEQEAADQFTRYRLRLGVYGQRQEDAQMMRVKIPGGIVSAEQLEVLGRIARELAPLGKGHITTRENIQYHHLKLEQAEEAMRLIGAVGLTSREACGNTVRNVITNPSAGVDPTEVFDTTPYLIAYVRYFVRKPFTQDMPRKFKTSFSSTPTDDAVAPYHDLGFIAMRRGGQDGFAMLVGGGSSIMPREAKPLYDFVPISEYLRVSEAVLRVFNAANELRKNRMMARIKVLIDRIGMDAFRERVEEELKQPWAAEPIDPLPYADFDYEQRRPEIAETLTAPEGPAEYQAWLKSNVRPQRQKGYATVEVTVPQGDLRPDQFDELARLSREFGNGRAQLSPEQNLIFRWVRLDEVLALWRELESIGLPLGGANEISNVVCCPGTDSCKLGITASMGLNRAMGEAIQLLPVQDPLVRDLHIKISGCPNGCGRHHLANIGFQGAAVKDKDGRQVPAYEVYVGGEFEKGSFRYAKRIAEKIPSKRAPEAMRRMVQFYVEGRNEGEQFNDFVDRVGPKSFGAVLQDLKEVSGLSVETFADYFDWERTTPYKLERGEGECAI
jgi:sulfite reductase beta subunit-like hemoprotein